MFAAAIRARSGEMRKADFISAPPVREGWVSVPREPTARFLKIIDGLRHPFKDARDVYKDLIDAAKEGK